MDLSRNDVVFVCRVECSEDGGHSIPILRTCLLASKRIAGDILTLTLNVDPDQFASDSRTQIYSNLNLIVKRTSSESNDLRIIQALSLPMKYSITESFNDSILGIVHPDEATYLEGIDSGSTIHSIPQTNLSVSQLKAVDNCINSAISICEGPFASGCTTVLKHSVNYVSNCTNIVICRSGSAVDMLYCDFIKMGIPEHRIVRLGFSSNIGHIQKQYNTLIKNYVEIINSEILSGLDSSSIYTCGEAEYILKSIIEPRWNAFKILLENSTDFTNIQNHYPFSKCFNFENSQNSMGMSKEVFIQHYDTITKVFKISNELAPLELLQEGNIYF